MDIIRVHTANTEIARRLVEALVKGLGGPDVVKAVRLQASEEYELPPDGSDSETWPCIFECEKGESCFEIRILSILFMGCVGDILKELLEYCGFGEEVWNQVAGKENETFQRRFEK